MDELVFGYVLKSLRILLNFCLLATSDLGKIVFLLALTVVATFLSLLFVSLLKTVLKRLLNFSFTLLNVLQHLDGDVAYDKEQLGIVLILNVTL